MTAPAALTDAEREELAATCDALAAVSENLGALGHARAAGMCQAGRQAIRFLVTRFDPPIVVVKRRGRRKSAPPATNGAGAASEARTDA